MAEVTIRRASADDALVVAALHLQFARELGMPSETGYLDRFVDAWLAERPDRPTWIAESRGEHAGILETRRIRALPWPGRRDVSWLHVGGLFVAPGCRDRGVGRALTEAMIEWSRTTDVTLSKAQCQKAAGVGHDGLARALKPVHTLFDGDTIFALATGERPAPDPVEMALLMEAGADCVARAIVHALLAATSVDRSVDGGVTLRSWSDAFPSALGGTAR